MSNWDVMEQNLATVSNSEGALQQQQDIYAESWEAASKRVKTSLQGIYDDLLDDEMFIDITNSLADFVTGIDNLIDAMGGLKGVLAMVAPLMFKMFGKDMVNGIQSFGHNLAIDLGISKKIGESTRQETNEAAATISGDRDDETRVSAVNADSISRRGKLLTEAQNKMLEIERSGNIITEQEKEQLKIYSDIVAEREKAVSLAVREEALAQEEAKHSTKELKQTLGVKESDDKKIDNVLEGYRIAGAGRELHNRFVKEEDNGLSNEEIQKEYEKLFETFKNIMPTEDLENVDKDLSAAFQTVVESLENLTNETGDFDQVCAELDEGLNNLADELSNFTFGTEEEAKKIKDSKAYKKAVEDAKNLGIAQLDTDVAQGTAQTEAEFFENFLDNIKGRGQTASESLVSLGESLSQVAMGITAVKGLGNIWSNEDISLTEKLSSSLFSMMAAMQGLSQIGEVTKSWKALTKALSLNNIAQSLGITLTNKSIKSLIAENKALISNIALRLAAKAAILGVVAVVGALIYAYQKYEQHLEKLADKETKYAESLGEIRQKHEEEVESIRELASEYENLLKTKEEQSLSNEDLRSKVFQLCLQYGEEGLAIKALAGDYENLTDAMKEAESANKKSLAIAAHEERDYITSALEANLFSEAGSHRVKGVDGQSDSIVLKGINGIFDSEEEKIFLQELETLGVKISNTDNATVSSVVNAIMTNREELNRLVLSSTTDVAKQFQGFLEDENIAQLVTQAEENKQVLLDNLVNSADIDINSIEDFQNTVETLTNKVIDEEKLFSRDNEEEAVKYVKEALAGISDEINTFAQKELLMNAILEGTEEADEEIKTILEDADSFMTGLIARNIATIQYLGGENGAAAGLEEFRNQNPNYEEFARQNYLNQTVGGMINQNSAYTNEQIDSLFSQGFNAVPQSSFESMNFEQQKAVLQQYYLDVENWSKELQEKVLGDLETTMKAALTEFGFEDSVGQDTEEIVKTVEEKAKKSADELAKYIAEIKSVLGEEFDEDYINKLINVEDISELSDKEQTDREKLYNHPGDSKGYYDTKTFKSLKEEADKGKEQAEVINSLATEMINVSEAGIDVATSQEAIEQQMTSVNTAIDDLQKSYKTLQSAVEEYNESGFFTMDTLQALVDMDYQYINALDFTNGQLSLNTTTLEQLANAQLDLMRVQVIAEAMTKLEALAKNESAEASLAAATNTDIASASMDTIIQKLHEGALAWETYGASMARNAGVDLSKYKDEAKEITDGMFKKLSFIDSFESESMGKNFAKSMGAASKSGGGSGKKTEKEQEDELDRYHDIERAIARVADAMETLSKQQEHLFGAELIASLKQENGLLKQQIANYERMGQIIDEDLSRLSGELSAYGVSFDSATGEILNYTQKYLELLKIYNDAVAAYNTSAQTEADKAALDAAKKKYDDFVKLVKEYDSVLDKRMENQQNKLDAQYKIIENNYKAWETEIQVKLDLGQAKQEWQKFWQDVDKDIKGRFKNYAKELGNISDNFHLFNNTTLATDLGAVQSIKNEIDKIRSGQGSDRYASESEAANDLLQYSNQLRDDAQSLYELYTDAWDEYLDSIDQVVDKWADLIDEFNDINDSLEHHANLIELMYGDGDMAKQLNSQIYAAQANNNLALMDSLRQATTALEQERAQMLAQGAKETDEDVMAITEAIKDNQKEMESAIESYVEGLTNQFQNAVQMAMDKMEKVITGGTTFKKVSEQWEDALYAAEGYYDQVERIYQLESMESKWQAAIDSTSSVKNQQKLKDLMDGQMEALEGKTKLSEYDIQLSEKRLAVAQAQIALEEAQNNKNSMKLTRNESGNWSYQYVADEESVASSEQDLLNANNDWYQFVKTSWQDLTAEILQDFQTAQERITELQLEMMTADEERRLKIQEELNYLNEYYYGEEGIIVQKTAQTTQMQTDLSEAMMNSLWDMYLIDEENYNLMTENEKAVVDGFREFVAGDEGVYQQILDKCNDVNAESLDSWTTLAKEVIDNWNLNKDSVRANVQICYDECKKAQSEYDAAIVKGTIASGIQFNNLGQEILNTAAKTDYAHAKVVELVNETGNLDYFRSKVIEIETAWYAVANAIRQATSDLATYMSALVQAKAVENAVNSMPGSVNSPSKTPADTASSGGKEQQKEQIQNANKYRYVEVTTKNGAGAGTYPVEMLPLNMRDKTKYNYRYFDTGGYTGDWNDGSGKLAVLHSKELVLNKEDTSNILSAVSAVRSIASLGSSVASSISNGISNMVKSLLNFKTPNYGGNVSNSNTTSNNTFDITMNVNGGDVEEIKTAILSLPNLATQYLSRNEK